jgi:hypothetical protein
MREHFRYAVRVGLSPIYDWEWNGGIGVLQVVAIAET